MESDKELNTESNKDDLSPSAKRDDDGTDAVTSPTDASETVPKDVRYGKCKWFNVAKGWGFITPDDGGNEVFVHQSVIQMDGFRSLGEQEEVEYEVKSGERGLEATRVSGRQGTDCHGSTFRPRTKKKHRRVRCYNCGEFAKHIASDCDIEPQPKCCHYCRSQNHLLRNCPERKYYLEMTRKHSPEHFKNDEDEDEDEDSETREEAKTTKDADDVTIKDR